MTMSISRRKFVGASAATVGGQLWPRAARSAQNIMSTTPKGVRIEDVSASFEDYLYRAPYRFGGRDVDRVTLLNVSITGRTRSGRPQRGVGSMTMGNVWSFPSKT